MIIARHVIPGYIDDLRRIENECNLKHGPFPPPFHIFAI